MENRDNVLKIAQGIIEVVPNTKYLNAAELTSLRNVDIPTTSAGLKRTNLENTLDELNILEKLYGNLQSLLLRPRIERLEGRAVGMWDSERNLVRVERKDGKFDNFGFIIGGQLYLAYYEALFLVEANRLQLEYNSIIMSIEQAYLLLLGEQNSSKYHEYLIYSNLTRVGYILVKQRNIHFQKQKVKSETDCVWAILQAELQNETVSDYVKKTPYFTKVKQRFDEVKDQIRNSIETKAKINTRKNDKDNDLKFWKKIASSSKRKASEETVKKWLTAKRHCNFALKVFQHCLVDFLKEEDEYKQFKEMFENFDLVPLKLNDKKSQKEGNEIASENETDDEEKVDDVSKLHINFDVYLHNEGFRKSSFHLPNFRVIIIQPNKRFPTQGEILAAHRLQLNPIPLLIVSVNDSKQIQAFLYYFS